MMILMMLIQDAYRIEEGKGAVLRTLNFRETPRAMAVSPDGATLAVGAGADVLLIDFETGKLRLSMTPGKGTVLGLAFDGKRVAAAMTLGIALLDAATGKLLWSVDGGASGIALGESVLTISRKEKTVRTWAVKDGAAGRIAEHGLKEPCRIAAAKGRVAIADAEGALVVLGSDFKPLWEDTLGLFPGLAFSPDGKRLALAYSQGGGRVHVREAATGDAVFDHSGAGEGELAVAWLDAKRLVTSCTRHSSVLVWKAYDAENDDPPEPVTVDEKFGIANDIDFAVAVGAKGIAVAGRDNLIRIFRIPKD